MFRSGSTRAATPLSWLVRLRYGALLSEAALVLLAERFTGIGLPVAKLLCILAVGLASNLALTFYARKNARPGEHLLGAVLALDVVLLSALLVLSGGPFNPFTSLYLVNIALAPLVVGPRWTWAIVSLSVVGFALLFIAPAPPIDHATQMRIHLKGMWIAFIVAAVFIGYFAHEVRAALARAESELSKARARQARSERLGALATLAAGTAHELGTPLSTIAVAAKELERRLGHDEDASLIRAEVERCRVILRQMSVDAGAVWSDGWSDASVASIVEASTSELPPTPPIAIEGEGLASTLHVPARSLAMALRGVVKNAQEASRDGQRVIVRASSIDGAIAIEVRDEGAGMSSDVLARAGEPFFTTKEPGKGMGLGLFLATAVAEHLGGELRAESIEGEGTRVTMLLPARIEAR